MKKLIINADDFGLHEQVNEGIIKGHETGLITSTSIMPSGQAFDHAVQLARQNPRLGIGVHLTLVAERTLTEPRMVPSLVDNEGKMPANYSKFLTSFVTGRVRLSEIRTELTAQVEQVRSQGVNITHLDSHQHLHVFPGIIDIVLDIARKFDIKAIRIPDEPYLFLHQGAVARVMARNGLTFLARAARKKASNCGLVAPDHFFGMVSGGNMSEDSLAFIIEHLPEGVSEVMMHPGSDNAIMSAAYGWPYHWQEELQAAVSPTVKQIVRDKGVDMISFGELAHE